MPTWVQAYLTASQPLFYPVVFLALYSSGLGAPVSADLVLLTIGYVAYQGQADYATLIILSIAAIMATDATLFMIAGKYGRRLLGIWPFRKAVTPERLDAAEGSYRNYGYRMIFAARFMPGIRTVFVFTGGLLKLDFLKFMLHDFAGALIVIPCTIYSVKWVAGNLEGIQGHMAKAQNLVLVGIMIIALAVFLRNRSRASSRTQ